MPILSLIRVRLTSNPIRLLVLLSLVFTGCAEPPSSQPSAIETQRPVPLILISLDGFRWDYFDRTDTPTLDAIAARGVQAEALIPAFPTETFPNHFTIVTGLHPANHGIIGNVFHDPTFKAKFRLGEPDSMTNERWWGGEPIWITAVKQGRKSATFFWPGSEVEFDGHRPTYWTPYDAKIPHRKRVDQVLAWLDLPQPQRPDFISLYFSSVDSAGHNHGPDSPEVADAIEESDRSIKRLTDGLKQRAIEDEVNLIVVSDHGMAAVDSDKVIYLDDFIPLNWVDVTDWGPNLMMRAKGGREREVLSRLKGAHPHLQVYAKSEIPERLHYRDNNRIQPILGMADEGWRVRRRGRIDDAVIQSKKGTHGYDNQFDSMHGIFLAAGPGFSRNARVEAFESVHLYNAMCALLGLEPARNDGDPKIAAKLLRAVAIEPAPMAP